MGKFIKGYTPSEETKRKMSERQKGKHTRTEFKKGHKLSDDTKRKISETRKRLGIKPPCHLGHKHSEEAKRKMSKNAARAFLGKHHTEEAKRKIRDARLRQKIKSQNTKIEQKIEKELQRRNIYYQSQVALCNITIVDFYLPEIRTIIYCDGDYWHTKPEQKRKDINQDLILMFHGFNVYRFTETEINKSPKRCINKIFRKIEYL